MWPIANAIVSTVKPKANATPNKPIPTSGNAAANTAEPQPPSTSQNVPNTSAKYLFIRNTILKVVRLNNIAYWFDTASLALDIR